jgi:putative transposase
MANQQLLAKIQAAYTASGGRYGSPRLYQEVKEAVPCSLNRVARLMQQHGIRANDTK